MTFNIDIFTHSKLQRIRLDNRESKRVVDRLLEYNTCVDSPWALILMFVLSAPMEVGFSLAGLPSKGKGLQER